MSKKIVFIGGYSRSGKQQPLSEPVLTPQGWVTMGDLCCGDFVVGSDGNPTEVTGVFPQIDRRVFSVGFSDGSTVRCGADHLWYVHTHEQRSKNSRDSGLRHKVLSTMDLIQSGLTFSGGASKYFLPTASPVLSGKTELHAYAIGYILGNGAVNGGMLCISFHSKYRESIISLLSGHLGLPTKVRNTSENGLQATYSWKGMPKEIQDLRNTGLSHQKKAPRDYLTWDYESRLGLLQGLMDSDGSVCQGRNSFSTTNLDLEICVRNLTRSLGGVASEEPWVDSRPRYASGRCVSLSVRMPVAPFLLRQDEWRKIPYSCDVAIKTITLEDYQEDSVCISVSAKDKLYVSNNYKLTHNSELLNKLEQKGRTVLSTSRVLDNVLAVRLKESGRIDTVECLINWIRTKNKAKLGFDPRQAKIHLAENEIVPNKGRLSLIQAAFAECPLGSSTVFFETLGGEELHIALKEAITQGYDSFSAINLRLPWDLPGADIRKLIPPHPVASVTWNIFAEIGDHPDRASLINNLFPD